MIYLISEVNFIRWSQADYIKVLGRGYRLQLDEADVAYCAKIFAEKYREYGGQMSGVHVFDEEGTPTNSNTAKCPSRCGLSGGQKKEMKAEG